MEAEILVEDDVNDDYEEWEKNVSKEARKKWNDVSKEIGEETTFTVGKKDLDEKFLSEVLLYLFKSNDQNVPAHLFLNKIKRSMTLDGYKAILVGCGRANKWELCKQIIENIKNGFVFRPLDFIGFFSVNVNDSFQRDLIGINLQFGE